MIKTAVIIAGGASTRLRPLTDDMPKTLIPVNGKPILHWILIWLEKYGIEHVVIGVAYKKEKIYDFIKSSAGSYNMKMDVSEHTVEGGTAQAFKLAIDRFVKDEDFIAMNGDELTNLDINRLYETHKKSSVLATIAVAPFHCRFSVVDIDENGRVVGFERDKKLQDAPVHIGINVFNRKVLELIPQTGNIEEIVFKRLADEKRMSAYMLAQNEQWMSVNTQKDLDEANSLLTSWLSS
ncbi:MAG: nucleotidyltransferase family protein [Candidatus Micrarchaeaceae archaeon]